VPSTEGKEEEEEEQEVICSFSRGNFSPSKPLL